MTESNEILLQLPPCEFDKNGDASRGKLQEEYIQNLIQNKTKFSPESLENLLLYHPDEDTNFDVYVKQSNEYDPNYFHFNHCYPTTCAFRYKDALVYQCPGVIKDVLDVLNENKTKTNDFTIAVLHECEHDYYGNKAFHYYHEYFDLQIQPNGLLVLLATYY
jgi:hypothetical protein